MLDLLIIISKMVWIGVGLTFIGATIYSMTYYTKICKIIYGLDKKEEA